MFIYSLNIHTNIYNESMDTHIDSLYMFGIEFPYLSLGWASSIPVQYTAWPTHTTGNQIIWERSSVWLSVTFNNEDG